jgi:hypothetical protein
MGDRLEDVRRPIQVLDLHFVHPRNDEQQGTGQVV